MLLCNGSALCRGSCAFNLKVKLPFKLAPSFLGNDEGMFKIDNTTGVIRVNGTIDREKTNIFRMKIKVSFICKTFSFYSTFQVSGHSVIHRLLTFDFEHYDKPVRSRFPITLSFLLHNVHCLYGCTAKKSITCIRFLYVSPLHVV